MNRLFVGIDLQEGFLTDEIKASDYVSRVCDFLAQQDSDRVVLTRFVNSASSNMVRLMDWDKMQAGDPATRLFHNLETAGYPIIQKSTYSSWVPEVRNMAKDRGCKEIILFGLDTEACVFKTALDIFDTSLRPIIIEDLCASSAGAKRHRLTMDIMADIMGVRQVIKSGEV